MKEPSYLSQRHTLPEGADIDPHEWEEQLLHSALSRYVKEAEGADFSDPEVFASHQIRITFDHEDENGMKPEGAHRAIFLDNTPRVLLFLTNKKRGEYRLDILEADCSVDLLPIYDKPFNLFEYLPEILLRKKELEAEK